MVPVKEAIQTGAWFLFFSNDDEFKFRLRVLSFTKLDLTLVDKPEEIGNHELGADWWLMQIEAVNLTKRSVQPEDLARRILLVDQDGFEFKVERDYHLTYGSQFGKQSGLYRFALWSLDHELIPKTKAVGAIPFRIPADDEAEYSLAMKDGTVREA
jgi:hypothetical protein